MAFNMYSVSSLHCSSCWYQHSTSWGKQKCENKSTKVKDSYRIHQKKEKEKKSMLSKNIPILSCWMAPNSRVQQDCTGYTVITIVCTSFTFCIIAFPGKPSRSLTSTIKTSICFPFNQNSAEVERSGYVCCEQAVAMLGSNRRAQSNKQRFSESQAASLLPPLTSPRSSLA